ncbi:MAG: OmpA family protein [Bacteroidota bacterium]
MIYDRAVQSNGDTIVSERDFGNWWFGIAGSISYSQYFGKLSLPNNFSTVANANLDFTSGGGLSYQGGLTAEWQPPEQQWGLRIAVSGYDYRKSLTSVVTENFINVKEYRSKGEYQYIGIAPSVNYTLPFLGAHAIAGFNIDILTKSVGTVEQVQLLVPEKIHEVKLTPIDPAKTRYGGHIGIGADVFMGEMSRLLRVRLMPYVLAEFGSNITSINNSSWNSVLIRGGMNLKLGINNIIESTLPFDSKYVEPPQAIASTQSEKGFTLINRPLEVSITELAVLGRNVQEEVEPEKSVQVIERVPAARIPTPRIAANQVRKFSFSTATSTSLSREFQTYLDGVIDFLKTNPRARLQIEGHTDNTGTIQETQKISDERAQEVVRYLMKKGITRGRLLASGLGSRRPAADNRTEAGRQQNRRVEVKVVP